MVPPFLAAVSGNKTSRAVVSDGFTGCWPQFALVFSPWCSMKIAVKTFVYERHEIPHRVLYISVLNKLYFCTTNKNLFIYLFHLCIYILMSL